MCASNRPGRNNAASIESGALVRATITTPFNSSTPSISLSNVVNTWFAVCEDPPSSDRSCEMASISSKKMIEGDRALAFANISAMAFSDSPTYLLKISGPFTAKKLTPDSVSNSFAVNVLEQPGGPYNNKPFGARMPNFLKVSASSSGS